MMAGGARRRCALETHQLHAQPHMALRVRILAHSATDVAQALAGVQLHQRI
jgi:hypothetical protein